MKKCWNCGVLNSLSQKTCTECGALVTLSPQFKLCVECGEIVVAHLERCSSCNASFVDRIRARATQTAPAAHPSNM